MSVKGMMRSLATFVRPPRAVTALRHFIHYRQFRLRQQSNQLLITWCADVEGRVLSIGSGTDDDGEGRSYRSYFRKASSYATSELTPDHHVDMILDVRNMPEIDDHAYDCIFCSGVLEHVDDYQQALHEITRVLRPGGVLLLGLPFRQAIHMAPNDFWRFTEYGIKYLLKNAFAEVEIVAVGVAARDFPETYWVKARKRLINMND